MLPKPNRLPASEISGLLRNRQGVRGEGIELIYRKQKMDSGLPAQAGSASGMTNASRFAFIVSTKIDKRATARNRMKRLMREAVRRQLPFIGVGVDGVFVVRRRISDNERQTESIVSDLLTNAGLLNQES